MEAGIQEFRTAGKIIFGTGSLAGFGEIAQGLGTRGLVVTGRSAMQKTGILDRLLNICHQTDVHLQVFAEVEPEPSLETVERCRSVARETGSQFLVGLGGGSAVDVAKAVAGMVPLSGQVIEYFYGDRQIDRPGLPWIAIPTTAGTGAEVTKNAVLTDTSNGVKQSIRSDYWYADVALVDPELTKNLPQSLTAQSGMDAFTQAIESYTSRWAGPLTDPISLDACRLIGQNISTAYNNGEDMNARTAMSAGSLLAGMALANARLGAVHGMAHPVGEKYHLPHGLVCAVLLPHVIRFNMATSAERYALIASMIGVENSDLPGFIEDLLEEFGIVSKLGELGLREEDFDEIVSKSLPSGSLKANPRPAGRKELLEILTANL